MVGRKRRLSSPRESFNATKRQYVDLTDDEEPLEAILAKIQAQEESEALAKQLQAQWDSASSGSGSNGGLQRNSKVMEAINVDSEDDEDDEAMARRLAKEWETEDARLSNAERSQVSSANSAKVSSSKGKARNQPELDVPTTKLREFEDLFIGEKKCACGKSVPSPRNYVAFSTQIPPPTLLTLLHAHCSSCKTNHCRGCFKIVSCPATCKGKGKDGTCPVLSCCAESRAIALFEALGGFDRQYLGESATSDARAKEAAAKNKSARVGTVGPGGTGYSMGSTGHGIGYNVPSSGRGRGRGTAKSSTSRSMRADLLTSHWDQIIVRALTTITNFLPSPYSESAQMYDMLPHTSIAELLSASQFPELLGNLLRNDSVTDWIARIDVYYAVIALLRRLADSELTIEVRRLYDFFSAVNVNSTTKVLIGKRWETEKSCGLEEWMWHDGEITWARDANSKQLVRTLPLYAHFRKLTKQCETFLSGASSMLQNGDGEDASDVDGTMLKAASLCGDIIAARDDIERAMRVMGKDPSVVLQESDSDDAVQPSSKKDKGKSTDSAIIMERTYAQECDRLAFAHVMLSEPSTDGNGLVYPSFNYAQQLSHTASATRNPKDRLHLIKELAVMATSLPAGVWMRVDEVRNDAIKIMIAGPEGTPYAGGLFEFDCYIPLEYPHKPPSMHLRTTGGGRVRFNPNLYDNGKVCLSLLGTWPGRPEEQWSPKSTLLQVLVSIQSMILVELPYFNEPGFGQAKANHPSSIKYNRNITMQTVRWAMVEWMKDEHKTGIWADVIASHFSIRSARIRQRILKWAEAEPAIRKYTPSSTSQAGLAEAVMDLDDLDVPGSPLLIQSGHNLYAGATSLVRNINPFSSGMDLVAEYDRGVKRIQEWRKSTEKQRE